MPLFDSHRNVSEMILIADSGSTKCDWRLIDGEEVIVSTSTMGLNPFFHDEAIITEAVSGEADLMTNAANVLEIHFYGAGCSSSDRNQIIEKSLKRVFAKAEIYVDHDVMGAAIAACQGKPGIACILGTGSNACFFDGKSIHQEIPSLGYILGDEGSGSWFGKQLLRDYLYNEPIPTALRQELESLGYEKNLILNRIYREPHANVYLASFVKILANYRDTEYVRIMIAEGMKSFLQRHVCSFSNFKDVPVCFVGSIAFHFQDILKIEAEKLVIRVGNIVKQPIDGLVEFHIGISSN